MAMQQPDAAGLIVFDEEVNNYVAPSTRQGQLFRLLHAIEKAEVGTHTDFAKPFAHFQQFLHRRGIVVVMSDFYAALATNGGNSSLALATAQRRMASSPAFANPYYWSGFVLESTRRGVDQQLF